MNIRALPSSGKGGDQGRPTNPPLSQMYANVELSTMGGEKGGPPSPIKNLLPREEGPWRGS